MRTKRPHSTELTRGPKEKRSPVHRSPLVEENSAGAVVFHRGARLEYLLIFSTYWEFPKGLIEPDENESEAAMREVREETGLDVELIRGFRKAISYFYRRGGGLIRKRVVFFLGQAQSQSAQVSWEHHQVKWLPFDAALAEIKYENSRETLKRADEFLNENSCD